MAILGPGGTQIHATVGISVDIVDFSFDMHFYLQLQHPSLMFKCELVYPLLLVLGLLPFLAEAPVAELLLLAPTACLPPLATLCPGLVLIFLLVPLFQ